MNVQKRVLALVLVFLLVALSVSSVAAQVTQIRFGTINDPAVDRVNQLLVENFEAAYPDIEVVVEYIPGADLVSTYTTQAAAGTLPDVIWLADLFVVPFAQGDIVFDMQPLADADESFDLSDIYENLLGLSRVNGEGLYMIPSSYDVVTMYYNQTMFEEAGAPLPTPEWTWDDYIAACTTILEATGKYCFANGGGLPTFEWWAWVVPFVQGYGGSLIGEDGMATLTTPETLAGFQAYVDLWTAHGIAQPLDFDAGGNCFIVGECATAFFIPGFMSAIRALDPQPFEWNVEVVPSHPEGKFTGMGTYGYAVSANAQDPALAWDFVKHLASADAQLAIASNYAGTPLLQSLREDPAVVNLEAPPANITAFIQNGDNGILPTFFPGDCGSLYAGQINQEIKDALEAAILGMMSVEEAFTIANDNINACLGG
jgi:multiple sugar transport system substrate-binding protein